MRSEQEARRAIERYGNTVRRLCMMHLKNHADTEDIFQTVFLKYVLSSVSFESDEHENAWLIRVTINACKDHLKSHWRKTTVPIEAAQHVPAPAAEPGSILASVNLLPPKYRAVIYLHYYEGYTAPEIAQLLGRLPSTVNTQLRRGREQLKTLLEKEGYP